LNAFGLGIEEIHELILRFEEQAARTKIDRPEAYLLQMGRNFIAERDGVTGQQLKAATSRDPNQRQAAFATLAGGCKGPSDACLARARRRYGDIADRAAEALGSKPFKNPAAADRAFMHVLASMILRERGAQQQPPTSQSKRTTGIK
jgi:hypothetical protein